MHLINLYANGQAFFELLAVIHRHFQLTWEMTKREIADKYAGAVVGMIWSVCHPIIQMGVYVYIFAYVFPTRMVSDTGSAFDVTTYMLSGLIPWLVFSEGMAKASTIIIANANLVKQVVFPIEILPVKSVLATFLTQLIGTTVLLAYVLGWLHTISWTYALLPVLFALQLLFMVGLSCFLGAIGTYFRDVKEFVQIFCIIGIYLMPIIYQPDLVPAIFQPVLYANPFSYMIWCYQDVCYYGFIAHPWAWPVFATLSVGSFCLGYRTFRKLKPYFGNVL